MRDALIISVIFHFVIVTLGIAGLPLLSRNKNTELRVIPIEMVKIGDVTKLKAQEKKPEPVIKDKPKPKKKTPERRVEMPPEPPKMASNTPLPDMKSKPKPKKVTTEKPTNLANKRTSRLTPKSKPRRFNPGKLSALLDKREKTQPSITELLKDKEYGKQKIISNIDLQQQIISIGDAITKHIDDNRCYKTPAGAKGAAELRVTIHMRLNPNGKLIGSPKVMDGGRMNLPGQEFFRTAAESALRAVRKCAPYDFLPKDQYELWRDMEINFNPEFLLNG